MVHKYGLLIYSAAAAYGDKFDVVTVENQYIWKNGYLGDSNPKNGQGQPIWDLTKIIPMLIVESSDWGLDHDDAINNAATAWDAANPDNTTEIIPQLIFESGEHQLIYSQLLNRENQLIENAQT